jgi:hypothetical protein
MEPLTPGIGTPSNASLQAMRVVERTPRIVLLVDSPDLLMNRIIHMRDGKFEVSIQ